MTDDKTDITALEERIKSRLDYRKDLGSALITIASGAMLAIGTAALSLADKHQIRESILTGLIVAIAMLVGSIYCGGRGISGLKTSEATKPKWFNRQSVFLSCGFVLAAVLLGIWLRLPPKPNPDPAWVKQLGEVRDRLDKVRDQIEASEHDLHALQTKVAALSHRVRPGKESRHR